MVLRRFFHPVFFIGLISMLVSTTVSCSSNFNSSSSISPVPTNQTTNQTTDQTTDQTTAQKNEQTLVLTDIDFDPEAMIPETQPIADYLATRLKQVGITQSGVKIAPDSHTVADWLKSGEVDLFFDSVYPVLKVMERSEATPILRRWKDRVPEYNTLFVTRQDSGLNAIAGLQGNVIALQNPDSSSGFMFPMVYLLQKNLHPIEQAEANQPVPLDRIGYVFSGRDETTVDWILSGKVIAGAIDSETWKEIPAAKRDQLLVIAQTEMYPRHIVLAGPSLSAGQIATLKTALKQMHGSSEGQKALKEFSDTAKFDEFPEGATATIERLNGAYQQLQAYLQQQSAP